MSEEHELLEETTQTVARQALDIPAGKEELFQVEIGELRRLIGALRPYRVPNARRRAGIAIAGRAVSSARGDAVISDLGDRFLRAASVLDPAAPLADSITALESAYTEAKQKTGVLESIYNPAPDLVGPTRCCRRARRCRGRPGLGSGQVREGSDRARH